MHITLVFYRLLFYCLWRYYLPNHCSACTVHKTGDSYSEKFLGDIMDRALRTKEDDMVTLQFPGPTTLAQPLVIDGVKRARLGQNASFSCDIPLDGSPDSLTWTVLGRTVFEDGRALSVSQVQYDVVQLDGVSVLRVINVSLLSTGQIVCFKDSTKATVLKRYSLIPRVTRAEEVFVGSWSPLQPIIVNQGISTLITCTVRLPLSPDVVDNVRNQYMWRHNGRLITVPREEPYMSFLPPEWSYQTATGLGPTANIPGASFTLNLHFPRTSAKDTGPVEFWFRPHRHLHEWVIQSTRLIVKTES
ncbi:uncharacterized protein LOC129596474 [Paramacrobiotus metropolitanus]|uniref:uncharacterized protein LOC129596474 n=1 Tax=Paramacrobiotus metropolitanus TaxID=2943436 RepID=UPI0024460768|nr:uncharacterized protein LOC129596474 [Paramacrobiotus metropolitanus]